MRKKTAVFLSLQLLSALFIGQIWSSRLNSIQHYADWIPTKATLARWVMGTDGLLKGTQATHGYRLNLGAWHGHQEFVYKHPLRPARIEFKFFLPGDSYFDLIFNKDDDGFCGIRIGDNALFPNIFFNAEDQGKFTSQTRYSAEPLSSEAWNSCEVQFSSATISLALNGRPVKTFDVPVKIRQRIGFRGSRKSVLVDDILIRTTSPEALIKEDFFNIRQILICSFIAFAGIRLAHLAVILVFSSFFKNPGVLSKRLALLNMNLLIVSFLLFAGHFLWAGRYPKEGGVLQKLSLKNLPDLRWGTVEKIEKEILARTDRPGAAGTCRILLMGSSQAWGAGARLEHETVARRLEDFLNQNPPQKGVRYECINAGMSGVDSTFLLECYKDFWLKSPPTAVVLMLSSNDKNHPEILGTNLQKLIDLNRSLGIGTFFVLEANSPEYPSGALDRAHDSMRKVAEKNGIRIANAHDFLKKRARDGFLWWDFVHLTSYGQELLARHIYENIHAALRTL
jgi:lysophospholipase L1-like esterase